MNPVLIATLTGAITAVCWGTTDWLVSKTSKRFNKFEINFAVHLPSVIIMLPIQLVVGKPLPTAGQMLVLILISVLFIGAFLSFIKALSSGLAGVVIPLANVYALVTLVLSTIFIGNVFTSPQIAAVIGIVAGAALLAYEKNHAGVPLRELHSETFYALGAAAMWGVGFFLVDTMIGDIAWQMLTGVTSTFMTLFALLLLAFKNKSKFSQALKRSLANRVALFAGVIVQIGAMSLYFGSERSGSVVIPAVIASSAPLIASGLAAAVDKERIGFVKRVGAVVVVAGIIILNLV